jgi:hypothetical protein
MLFIFFAVCTKRFFYAIVAKNGGCNYILKQGVAVFQATM